MGAHRRQTRPLEPVSVARAARANWIGRGSLYTFSAFAISLGLSALLVALVLLAPEADLPWFLPLLEGTLVATSGLAMLSVVWLYPRRALDRGSVVREPLGRPRVHVGLTCYNDRAAIAATVREFVEAGVAQRVVVVDNDSTDGSADAARDAGADAVVCETLRGYGACAMRALSEAARGLESTDVVVLCEGDQTFDPRDVPKLVAYLDHGDMVVGTRTLPVMREADTQMDAIIDLGNRIIAKLVRFRFPETRFTDCGCTFRALRAGSYFAVRSRFTDTGMTFNFSMLVDVLRARQRVIEVPIVFRKRVGTSKGVGSNKPRAVLATLDILKILYSS